LAGVRKVEVFGLPIWQVSTSDLTELVKEWVEAGEGHWIATLNLDYISRCNRDPEFDRLLRGADVFTADGMPVLWASKKLDPSFDSQGRTTGADLTPRLLQAIDPSRVAIIGGVDPAAALKILDRNPEQYFIFDGKVELTQSWAECLSKQIAGRNLVLVALGCPKQEQLIALLRPLLPNAVFIAVGGSFEMIAGIRPRAPKWMQKSGLEWLFRLAIEPRRLWRRYLIEYPPGALALYRAVSAARRTAANKLPPS
jgi:N-acetylglucosaminyldiphosphoundecaprenol N-acetyl-beta-D-mannosaminyltransferase